MKIKYKVVKRRSRMSAMINGNSKYARRYLDGEAVYAHGETFGIFVFETLGEAESWAAAWFQGYDECKDLIVLKVIPIGRGKKLSFIADGVDTETLDNFYGEPEEDRVYTYPPNRTMAYPGVHVLGEYEWA